MKKDLNTVLLALKSRGESQFSSLDDVADWLCEDDSRLALLDRAVPFKVLAKEMGLPENRWDVVRALKTNTELLSAIQVRVFNISVNPLAYKRMVDNMMENAGQSKELTMPQVAFMKLIEQQKKTLQPAQVSVQNKNTFEFVIRSADSVVPRFIDGYVDAEFSTVGQLGEPERQEIPSIPVKVGEYV